jgi:nucleoside-diphosphate-sugar epimerase
MSARSFLVTGGAGFIGTALVKRLVQHGHSVRVLDNISRGRRERLGNVINQIDLRVADVRDAKTVRDAAKRVDTVIHLAAVNGTEFFYSKPELVLDVGVRGMLAVLDACREQGVNDLVVASSSEVYQSAPSVPTDETVPLSIPDVMNARYSYAGSKIVSELLAINYGRAGFKRVCIFRPHNVYGPDMGWEHVIPQFALRAKDAVAQTPRGNVPFEIQGDGSQTRAFVHIDDFTNGLMTVIEKGAHLGLYHIGTEEEMTIAELARLVVAWFGREAELIQTTAPAGATPRRCPDIGRLKALGYTPRIRLKEGLAGTIAWYVENAHRRPSAA